MIDFNWKLYNELVHLVPTYLNLRLILRYDCIFNTISQILIALLAFFFILCIHESGEFQVNCMF